MATYYIDPDNGDDTHDGLRIDSTVDSTADTTHFVDNALTGADDYINGGYFYNVTRGLGSQITDFVAATDTVTLGTAITGMTAGDTYYILNTWVDLDTFTEAARSAGDKVIIRRGSTTQIDDGTDLTFTSNGTILNPIIVESDYDNLWHDQVDLSATATATLTFGSKTVTYSSDISGVLAAGDWIYASGDNNREFAYEVASVSTVTATLYLPYKGAQAGSGKTTYNMQNNPIWNSAAGDFQWNFDGDNYWKVQGIHIRGTDSNGNVEIDSCWGHQLIDCILEANGALDRNINHTDDSVSDIFTKCRFTNAAVGFGTAGVDLFGEVRIYDCLVGSSGTLTQGILEITQAIGFFNFYLRDTEFGNYSSYAFGNRGNIHLRNVVIGSSTEIQTQTAYLFGKFTSEDHDGNIGDNRFHQIGSGANLNAVIYQSETSTIRSGGSNKSIKVTPSTNLNTIWDFNKLMIFELPIYATTDSKTYTVYFKPDDTAEWTADPTESELWIELEAWGHATNNFRKITKSTGTIDMNGSSSWQSLTVTVAPAQAGIAYLRCWYAKTKESSKTNIFYVDPIPVIS